MLCTNRTENSQKCRKYYVLVLIGTVDGFLCPLSAECLRLCSLVLSHVFGDTIITLDLLPVLGFVYYIYIR